jgi:hypothetical protein
MSRRITSSPRTAAIITVAAIEPNRTQASFEKAVSLRQNGVGTGFIGANAILPKGYATSAGCDVLWQSSLPCAAGDFGLPRQKTDAQPRSVCGHVHRNMRLFCEKCTGVAECLALGADEMDSPTPLWRELGGK